MPNLKAISHLIIVVSLMLVNLPSLQASEVVANKEVVNDIQALVKRGKLVVAMYSKDAPPFYFVDKNNQLTGFDVVLIEGFAKLLNIPIEFNRSAKFLNDTVALVESHEADVAITKLSLTFKRASRVLFTEPYVNLHQSLLINRLELIKQLHGRPQEEAIQHLSGKLGVVAKSSYVDYAKHFDKMELVTYSSWADAIEDAHQGKITAAFRDDAEVKLILRDHPEYALDLMSVLLKDANDPKGIAVAIDRNQLKNLLDFYLKTLDWHVTGDIMINDYDNEMTRLRQKIAMQEQQ